MTREDMKRQVLARVKVPAEFLGMADKVMDGRLGQYPKHFVFSPTSVLFAERLLQRELNHAQRKASNALRDNIPKRP